MPDDRKYLETDHCGLKRVCAGTVLPDDGKCLEPNHCSAKRVCADTALPDDGKCLEPLWLEACARLFSYARISTRSTMFPDDHSAYRGLDHCCPGLSKTGALNQQAQTLHAPCPTGHRLVPNWTWCPSKLCGLLQPNLFHIAPSLRASLDTEPVQVCAACYRPFTSYKSQTLRA